ncbi:MAG: hypothetical protein ACLSE6_08090 [Alphaproteobacteria bacterium]
MVGVYDIFSDAAKAAAETFGIKLFFYGRSWASVDAVSVYHIGHPLQRRRLFLNKAFTA